MKDRYVEIVDAKTFIDIRDKRKWDYEMPMRKRHVKLLPDRAFALGDDLCVVLEGPRIIRFRKRWGLRFVDREIRLVYIVNDGKREPYLKIHLV